MLKGISFKAQRDTSVELRTESYLGRDWLVVPVIALVEGVLQGMNAPAPELALSSEFGRVPEGWNGRPIVMNHPVMDGSPVSANSPAVLEQFSFGQIFNARVEEGKLKVDAFIDLERVEVLGGEIGDTVKALQDATRVVEVSTGLYSGMEEKVGRFNGKEYAAVWRNIVPDHLAFLSEGVKGACSVEDGCGTPRLNAAALANSTPATPAEIAARWNSYALIDASESSSDCGCGCGGACKTHSHDDDENKEPKAMRIHVAQVVRADPDPEKTVYKLADNQLDIAALTQTEAFSLVANAIPGGLIDHDVRKLLQMAVGSASQRYNWVIGFTNDKVIYEGWDNDFDDFATWQRSYNISADRKVTLEDDVEQVVLLTEIMPTTSTTERTGGLFTNSETTGEEEMPEVVTPPVVTPETATTPAPVVEPAAVVVNTVATPAKVKTQAEYLAEMPEGMREVVENGIKMHNDKKAAVIKGLQDSGRCKFTIEALNAKKLEELEMLAELAQVPQNFSGVAAPTINGGLSLVDNGEGPDAPPELFPVTKAVAAA